jgi:hypothetical protein
VAQLTSDARLRLEALLFQGLESGPATEMTDEDRAEIRCEGLRRLELKKRLDESPEQ